MFKKLKDKIAEEVKSSPQRIAELAQTVQNTYNASSNGATPQKQSPSNSNQFSITEEETPQNSPSNTGFTNINLGDTKPMHTRRDSCSSIASDASLFLPRYESQTNLYHLQSDLDISASEIEDNLQYSTQFENISKDNLYKAYSTMRAKYNKYRGRYSDLAKHYRDLEREHTRTKSILVETQDKTLRRVSELKEQCLLEQTAKAHLEQELRIDLDEKQLTIDALKQKVGLLQKAAGQPVDVSTNFNISEDDETPSDRPIINNEILIEDLKQAKTEIERLQKLLNERDDGDDKLIDFDTDFAKKNDAELLSGLLLETERDLRAKQSQIDGLMNKCKEGEGLERKLHELTDENFNFKLQVESLNARLTESENRCKKLSELGEELERERKTIDELHNKEKVLLEGIENLKRELAEEKSKVIVLKSENDEIAVRFKQQSIHTERKLVDIESTCQKGEQELSQLRNSLKARDAEISKLKALEAEIIVLRDENERLKSHALDIESEKKKCEDRISELTSTIENSDGDIETFSKQIGEMRRSNDELLVKVSVFENEQASCQNKISGLTIELDSLNDEKKKLQKQLSEIESLSRYKNDSDPAVGFIIDDINDTIKVLAGEKHRYEKQISMFVSENNTLREKISASNEKCKSLSENVRSLESELKNVNLELLNSRHENGESKSFLEEISFLKSQVDRLNEDNLSLSQEISFFKSQFDELNKENLSLSQEVSLFKSENGELQNKNLMLAEQIPLFELQNDKFLMQNSLLSEQIAVLKSQSDELNQQNMLLSQEIPLLKSQNDELREKNLSLSDEIPHLNSQNNNLNEKIVAYSQEIALLKSQTDDLNHKLGLFSQEIALLKSQNDEIAETNIDLQNQMKHLSAQNDSLDLEIALKINECEQTGTELATVKTKLADKEKLSSHHEKLFEELNISNEKVHKITQELVCLKNERSCLISELDGLRTEIDLVKSENDKLTYEVDLCNLRLQNETDTENKICELENVNEKLHSENSELKNRLAESVALIEQMECLKRSVAETETLRDRLAYLEKYNEQRDEEFKVLEETGMEIEILKQQISALDTELKTKHEEIEQLQEYRDQFSNLDEINMNLKKQARLQEEKIAVLENDNVSNLSKIGELTRQLQESNEEYDSSKKRFNFYESEIEKLHNRNQKLTEKLDETLVILNHTSQFESDGTEMEYLRNILYSYMTGKESLILAKVIAAVCKFSQEQTNTILQRETQKQTLLGQLGFV